MNQEKVKKIRELLDQIYAFDNKEIRQLMIRIPTMEERGLNELESSLTQALERQNDMLKKWTERDPKFADDLGDFANKTAATLIREGEVKERASAEDVLKEIQ